MARIEIIDPLTKVDRSKNRTELMMTRRFHSWLLRYGQPGQLDKMHCHNEDETFVCVEGECTMTYEDGGRALRTPGMDALSPGGAFYQVQNTGKGEMILMGSRSGSREATKNIKYEDRQAHREMIAAARGQGSAA